MNDDLFTWGDDRKKSIKKCNPIAEGKIIVPKGVTRIDSYAFHNCIYITEIVLPDTVGWIEDCAFRRCISLERINIPEGVTELAFGLFQGCVNLKEVVCQKNITSIRSSVFKDCKSLLEFLFTDNITYIGPSAFRGCDSLRSVYISKNLDKISDEVFAKCSSIETVEIPSNIESIGCSAFANCDNLRRVIIHPHNIKITPSAFCNNANLTTVSISSNPERILTNFPACENLKTVYLLSSEKGPQKIDPTNIWSEQEKELRYMALYYRLFGMNLSQIKWDNTQDDTQCFKSAFDKEWKRYCKERQPIRYILNWDWTGCVGLGVILGYNQYRALDIDFTGTIAFDEIYPNQGLNGFIDEMLGILNLPKDYPWVVRSGSGSGFHIIFRCEGSQVTDDIETISYTANKYYSEITYGQFIRIELRWNDHLVLPPSVHMSGYHYKFRNGNLPTTAARNVSLHSIEELAYKYCSEIKYRSLTYEGISFEVAECYKIKSIEQSRFLNVYFNTDSVVWLQQGLHEEESNLLAIKLLIGEEIEADAAQGIKILKNLSCQTSKFNLLNLYACGYLELQAYEIKKLYDELDKELFDSHLDLITEKIVNDNKTGETYILFDTETTGLPKDYDAPASNNDNWPRLVQLSWLVVDSELNIISENDYVIKPDGFTIPLESSRMHGITTEKALQNGYQLNDVLQKFNNDFEKCSKCIGHNIDYDKKVVASEFLRNGMTDIISDSPSECTMKSTVHFCKISGPFGYKYPKLDELYAILFDSTLENAHNSMADIRATLKCYKELKKRGIMLSIEDFF